MNPSAANKLSALMNQCDVIYCDEYYYRTNGARKGEPRTFQRIIESGIREAEANKQKGI
ncbi:hypothetical protein DPMN_166811 [Dreissena polymorpha]|uniref:Uncharacterized protein n=1 Tax=Dreissena polymorpha TaxID=45954 RepID=A0A9D4EXK4_DREPO|nr:hypothetical protein DPMN_166811 [Dreissena polymorpha]